MEAALKAIANPKRRAILELVWDAERTASEIADGVGLSKPAASQHLRVLKQAELVTVRADRNRRLYRVRSDRMEELHAFLEGLRGGRPGALKEAAERVHAERTAGA